MVILQVGVPHKRHFYQVRPLSQTTALVSSKSQRGQWHQVRLGRGDTDIGSCTCRGFERNGLVCSHLEVLWSVSVDTRLAERRAG